MKIIGYILKGMSLYILVAIIRMIYAMITGNVPAEIKSKGEETGYIIGQVIILVVSGILAYLLYRYSNKLIKNNSPKTEEKS